MIKRMLVISLIGAFLFLTFDCFADQIVFEGTPVVRARGSLEKSYNEQLSEKGQEEYKLIIVKTGDDYIWRSRENKKLVYHKSGIYDYFNQPEGAGYIKITKNEDGYVYMEHIHLGLETITYWGISEELNIE